MRRNEISDRGQWEPVRGDTGNACSRREFLTLAGAAPLLVPFAVARTDASGAPRDDVFLIAHRGGVVDDRHPENSPSSAEAAIDRGFRMLEVDIRRSRDGHAVVQHDATFQRFYGVSRAVDHMTWSEIEALRATPGGSRPMQFDELCARCSGRMRLMLDIKGADHPGAFYGSVIASLRRHQLLETTFSLSGGPIPELTKGVVARAVDRRALAAAIERGEPVATTCYLFELGSVLDEAALALCRDHRVTPVAALNTFRYEQAKIDHWKGAEADAKRLLALGVRHFQIDSIYDRYFT
jgi:glycerophosphoryl diester phosphodiesterase